MTTSNITGDAGKYDAEDEALFREFLAKFEQGEKNAHTRSVLVVDDEPTVRHMVSRSIMAAGGNVNVYQAENGLEALQVFEQIRKKDGADPVLIVTDLQMPVMDGWDFIDKLWDKFQAEKRDFGVPLIVLSASTGSKGMLFGKSVHGAKCKYSPIVTIAKEDCTRPMKYDTTGEKGLLVWLRHFMKK